VPAYLPQAQADWLHRSIDATASAALAVYEFYARVTTASERPLYFVLLEVAPAKGAALPNRVVASEPRAFEQRPAHMTSSTHECARKPVRPACSEAAAPLPETHDALSSDGSAHNAGRC